jgi:hypothetical protein
MRNKFLKIIISVTIMALALLIFGCTTTGGVSENLVSGDGVTKFEGEWNYLKPLDAELRNDAYVFTGDKWKYLENNIISLSGIFTFNKTSITFNIKEGDQGSWTQGYTLLEGLSLTLKDHNHHPSGHYISSDIYSQKNDLSSKFDGSWRHPNRQSKNATYLFSGNWFKFTNEVYSRERAEGIFIFNDKEISFIILDRYSYKRDVWTQKYSINGDTLTLERHPSHTWGPFLKK